VEVRIHRGSYTRRFVYTEVHILINTRGVSYTVNNLIYSRHIRDVRDVRDVRDIRDVRDVVRDNRHVDESVCCIRVSFMSFRIQ
jgi:hypothetical protein